MKWYEIFTRFFGKSEPAPAPDPATRPDPNEKYRDPAFQNLSARCAMGDIVAMLDLARWHRQFAHPEGGKYLAAYEQDPENHKNLQQWLDRNRYGLDGFHLRCYITWVFRAALYGNPQAEALMERCPKFRDWGLLPQTLYGLGPTPRYRSSQRLDSYKLHRLGLTGIDEDLEELSLYPMEDGIFSGYFLEDYIPADSDGFGREDFYEDLFYDEFFNRLQGTSLSRARPSAERLIQERRAYWEDPAHDQEHRMYKRLLSHKK